MESGRVLLVWDGWVGDMRAERGGVLLVGMNG